MPITGVARRRACTLATITTLTAGLFSAVAIAPADAAPSAVEVGAVADQLVDKDGTTLWLAGTNGITYGPASGARTLIDITGGARSLAQAADGTVYATSDHTLYAIATDHSVSTVSTGAYDCLGDVAATSGAVWVVSACTASDPHLVRIAGGTVTADVVTADKPGSMRLASSAGAPDELIVSDHSTVTYTDSDGDHEYLAPRFRAFDTSGATPTEISQAGFSGEGSLPSLELSRDGSTLLAGANDYFLVFDVRSPSKYKEFYRGTWDVTASAFSADGRFVALAHQNGAANLLDLYTADGTWLRSLAMTNPVEGLAWQGSSLATITRPTTGADQLDLRASAYRTTPRIESNSQYDTVYWDQRVTGGGRVTTETGDPVRAMRLTLTRTGGGTTKDLGTVVTGDDGTFSWTNKPGLAGKYTYKVTTPTDDVYVQKSGSASWTVSHHSSGLRITTDHSRYIAGQTALVTATLPRHYTNRTVALYAQGGGQRRVLLRRGPVNSSGKISVRIYIPFTATLTASYGGDARYSSSAVKVTRYAKARIDTALSKPARKSGSYYVYKAKKGSTFYAAVRPAQKGANVHFTLQRYTHGHWHNYLIGDVKQTKDGYAGIRYAGKPGVKYRERASVGDTKYALANVSGWRYLTFTS